MKSPSEIRYTSQSFSEVFNFENEIVTLRIYNLERFKLPLVLSLEKAYLVCVRCVRCSLRSSSAKTKRKSQASYDRTRLRSPASQFTVATQMSHFVTPDGTAWSLEGRVLVAFRYLAMQSFVKCIGTAVSRVNSPLSVGIPSL